MESKLFTPAQLSTDQLARIRRFESETGHIILAFEARQQPIAQFDADQQERLKALEEDLGLVVVAYDTHDS